MPRNSLRAKPPWIMGIVRMGITAFFTIASGVRTTCVALPPPKACRRS